MKTIKVIQLARHVVKRHQWMLFRVKGNEIQVNNAENTGIAELLEMYEPQYSQMEMVKKRWGWVMLDAITAGAYVAIYEALSPEARAKLEAFDPMKQFRLTMKLFAQHGKVGA